MIAAGMSVLARSKNARCRSMLESGLSRSTGCGMRSVAASRLTSIGLGVATPTVDVCTLCEMSTIVDRSAHFMMGTRTAETCMRRNAAPAGSSTRKRSIAPWDGMGAGADLFCQANSGQFALYGVCCGTNAIGALYRAG